MTVQIWKIANGYTARPEGVKPGIDAYGHESVIEAIASYLADNPHPAGGFIWAGELVKPQLYANYKPVPRSYAF